jgi:hypothetical protein
MNNFQTLFRQTPGVFFWRNSAKRSHNCTVAEQAIITGKKDHFSCGAGFRGGDGVRRDRPEILSRVSNDQNARYLETVIIIVILVHFLLHKRK